MSFYLSFYFLAQHGSLSISWILIRYLPEIRFLYGAPNGSKIVFWKGRYFFRDRDTSCGKGDTSSDIKILLAESEILF